MPNRLIRERAIGSQSLAQLSAEAERLFWRLQLRRDDWGLFEADSTLVRASCLPRHDVTLAAIDGWMAEIVEAGIVACYEVCGRLYGCFLHSGDHNGPPRSQPKYPEPPAHICVQLRATDNRCAQWRANDLPTRTHARTETETETETESETESEGKLHTSGRDQTIEDKQTKKGDADASPTFGKETSSGRPKRAPAPEASAMACEYRKAAKAAGVPVSGTDSAWAAELDKVHRLDGASWTLIDTVLRWCLTDKLDKPRGDWDGWWDKVRSLASLRVVKNGESKWSKLLAAYEAAQKAAGRARHRDDKYSAGPNWTTPSGWETDA